MPVLTFLTDYGLLDEFVGICHGVIARLAPEVRVIDVTHGIPRHDVRAGALVLRGALPYTPPGVHLAVVDPAVGARRRAVAPRPPAPPPPAAAPSPCAAPRRTACSSDPTTACSCSPPRASGASWRRSRS